VFFVKAGLLYMLNNCVPRAHSYSAVETEKKISIAVLRLKPYR